MSNAFLINYRDCFNCHSCEVACQMLYGYEPKTGGIKVNPVGPWEYAEGKWEYDYVPFYTQQCNGCAGRASEGKEPSCVQHCEGECLHYGTVEEMLELQKTMDKSILQVLEKPDMAGYAPVFKSAQTPLRSRPLPPRRPYAIGAR